MTSRLVHQETLDTRRLLTLRADHPFWTGGSPGDLTDVLVRAYPPPGSTDEALVIAKARLAGAAGVRMMPRPTVANHIVNAPSLETKAVAPRESVLLTVRESTFSNKAALEAYCVAIMDEAGI